MVGFEIFKKVCLVVASVVIFTFLAALFGMVGTMILMIFLHKGTGDPLTQPEVGLTSVFWSINAAVVFGILGGILGLILGIKWVRRK